MSSHLPLGPPGYYPADTWLPLPHTHHTDPRHPAAGTSYNGVVSQPIPNSDHQPCSSSNIPHKRSGPVWSFDQPTSASDGDILDVDNVDAPKIKRRGPNKTGTFVASNLLRVDDPTSASRYPLPAWVTVPVGQSIVHPKPYSAPTAPRLPPSPTPPSAPPLTYLAFCSRQFKAAIQNEPNSIHHSHDRPSMDTSTTSVPTSFHSPAPPTPLISLPTLLPALSPIKPYPFTTPLQVPPSHNAPSDRGHLTGTCQDYHPPQRGRRQSAPVHTIRNRELGGLEYGGEVTYREINRSPTPACWLPPTGLHSSNPYPPTVPTMHYREISGPPYPNLPHPPVTRYPVPKFHPVSDDISIPRPFFPSQLRPRFDIAISSIAPLVTQPDIPKSTDTPSQPNLCPQPKFHPISDDISAPRPIFASQVLPGFANTYNPTPHTGSYTAYPVRPSLHTRHSTAPSPSTRVVPPAVRYAPAPLTRRQSSPAVESSLRPLHHLRATPLSHEYTYTDSPAASHPPLHPGYTYNYTSSGYAVPDQSAGPPSGGQAVNHSSTEVLWNTQPTPVQPTNTNTMSGYGTPYSITAPARHKSVSPVEISLGLDPGAFGPVAIELNASTLFRPASTIEMDPYVRAFGMPFNPTAENSPPPKYHPSQGFPSSPIPDWDSNSFDMLFGRQCPPAPTSSGHDYGKYGLSAPDGQHSSRHQPSSRPIRHTQQSSQAAYVNPREGPQYQSDISQTLAHNNTRSIDRY